MELIEIFQQEVDANLKEATRLVLQLEQLDTGEPEQGLTEALMRVFHTLKGAARAIGFEQEKQIAHRLEDVFHDLLEGNTDYRPELPDLSLSAIDLFRDTVAARRSEGALPGLDRFERQVEDYQAGRVPTVNAAEAPADASIAGSETDNQPGNPATADASAPLPDTFDLLGIFSTQVQGHLVQARAALSDLEREPMDATLHDTLRRIFHTIKGAARAIGVSEIRDAAVAIEELLQALADAPAELPAAVDGKPPTSEMKPLSQPETAAETTAEIKANAGLVQLAGCALDYIEVVLSARIHGGDVPSIEPLRDQVARFRRGEPLGSCPEPAMTTTEQAAAGAEPPLPADPADAAPPRPSPETSADIREAPRTQTRPPIPGLGKDAPLPQSGAQAGDRQAARHQPAGSGTGSGTGARERASIAYEQLDRLYRLSGELTVSVSALSGQRHQLRTLALELSQSLQQLNRLASVAQTDALARESLQESLRGVTERLTRASSECATLGGLHDRMEGRLTHLSDDLADEVTQARLVPLSELLDDYPRMLRDLAQELGKRVELHIDGAENRIDRAVLERLRDPLRHMVRNALGHGIETADERRRLGKTESGRLIIEARQLGSMMRIRVADDGRGIDLDRLRQTVIDNGHTSAKLWEAMGIDEKMQFLFLPGLSTATTVDTTQGRGFGLDIVKARSTPQAAISACTASTIRAPVSNSRCR